MAGIGITTLAIVVAALTVWLVARVGRGVAIAAAVIIAAVMVVEYALAANGILREWTRRPPPLMLAVAVPLVLAIVVALSGVGRRVAGAASFAAIIAIQAFRLPLELVMHRAATIGLMPVQMSYSGRNFDIVTGALAIVVAWLAARSPRLRAVVLAWNIVGTLLLINIVTIAIASTPTFFRVWSGRPQYVGRRSAVCLSPNGARAGGGVRARVDVAEAGDGRKGAPSH